jgi:hypothetical protein
MASFNPFLWLKDKIDDWVIKHQLISAHKREIKQLREDAYYRQTKENSDKWAKIVVERELKEERERVNKPKTPWSLPSVSNGSTASGSVNSRKNYKSEGFNFDHQGLNNFLIGKPKKGKNKKQEVFF